MNSTAGSAEPWTIVRVPFPYVELNARKWRPALTISTAALHERTGLCWVLMITSAGRDPWPGDVPLRAAPETGLSKPSLIRCAKIACAEIGRLEPIGVITADVSDEVCRMLASHLACTHRDLRLA